MNKDEATIKINPIDDIQFVLEDSGCYNEEIEAMKTAGTYDAFIHKVYNAIDWSKELPVALQCERLLRVAFLLQADDYIEAYLSYLE